MGRFPKDICCAGKTERREKSRRDRVHRHHHHLHDTYHTLVNPSLRNWTGSFRAIYIIYLIVRTLDAEVERAGGTGRQRPAREEKRVPLPTSAPCSLSMGEEGRGDHPTNSPSNELGCCRRSFCRIRNPVIHTEHFFILYVYFFSCILFYFRHASGMRAPSKISRPETPPPPLLSLPLSPSHATRPSKPLTWPD